jgi:hypothetical protein
LNGQFVLVVENLHTLFADTDDDFGWQLREVLQTENKIILLGTPTSKFSALEGVDEPFFELLRIAPLNRQPCGSKRKATISKETRINWPSFWKNCSNGSALVRQARCRRSLKGCHH